MPWGDCGQLFALPCLGTPLCGGPLREREREGEREEGREREEERGGGGGGGSGEQNIMMCIPFDLVMKTFAYFSAYLSAYMFMSH